MLKRGINLPLFSYNFYMFFKFNSSKCVLYAKNYIKRGNSFYKIFDGKEEDCNFVCQCVLSGCESLNSKSCQNWYYESEKNYSETWYIAESFLKYLLTKNPCGPFGRLVNISNLSAGDLVFFGEKDKVDRVGVVTKIEHEKIFYISKYQNSEEKIFDQS